MWYSVKIKKSWFFAALVKNDESIRKMSKEDIAEFFGVQNNALGILSDDCPIKFFRDNAKSALLYDQINRDLRNFSQALGDMKGASFFILGVSDVLRILEGKHHYKTPEL